MIPCTVDMRWMLKIIIAFPMMIALLAGAQMRYVQRREWELPVKGCLDRIAGSVVVSTVSAYGSLEIVHSELLDLLVMSSNV